jgi:hypothetical protein
VRDRRLSVRANPTRAGEAPPSYAG